MGISVRSLYRGVHAADQHGDRMAIFEGGAEITGQGSTRIVFPIVSGAT